MFRIKRGERTERALAINDARFDIKVTGDGAQDVFELGHVDERFRLEHFDVSRGHDDDDGRRHEVTEHVDERLERFRLLVMQGKRREPERPLDAERVVEQSAMPQRLDRIERRDERSRPKRDEPSLAFGQFRFRKTEHRPIMGFVPDIVTGCVLRPMDNGRENRFNTFKRSQHNHLFNNVSYFRSEADSLDSLLKIIIMIAIGATIGGVTNFFAIKMLFRPHEPKYIGKMRVPFTPGLIPKRRDELASSLGKTVVKHLLTPEGMRKRLLDEQISSHITHFVQTEVEKMLRSEKTVRSLIEPLYPDAEERILTAADARLRDELTHVLQDVKTRKLYELLGEEGMDRVRAIIPEIVDTMLIKSEEYFYSVEGEAQLRHMVDSFVQRRLGFIAGFIQNVNFVEMIRPEIINILRGSSTRAGMATMITREFERFSERPVATFIDEPLEKRLIDGVVTEVVTRLPVGSLLDRTVYSYTRDVEARVVEELVPKGVTLVIMRFTDQMETIMDRLKIDQIVQEQVRSLDTSYLEEIVLSISKREFRAITWLGALLGGMIGLIQGLIAII